jgi:hypothetical protein
MIESLVVLSCKRKRNFPLTPLYKAVTFTVVLSIASSKSMNMSTQWLSEVVPVEYYQVSTFLLFCLFLALLLSPCR